MIIEYETQAWLTPYCLTGPEDFKRNPERSADLLLMMNGLPTWTRVGTARVRVEIEDEHTLVEAKVSALRAELAEARAEAALKQNGITDRINKLLALTHEPSTGVVTAPLLDDDQRVQLAHHREQHDGGVELPPGADSDFASDCCPACNGEGFDSFGRNECRVCNGRGAN